MMSGLIGLAQMNKMRNRALAASSSGFGFTSRASTIPNPGLADPDIPVDTTTPYRTVPNNNVDFNRTPTGNFAVSPTLFHDPVPGVQPWGPSGGPGWKNNATGNQTWDQNAGVPRFGPPSGGWQTNASPYQWGPPSGVNWAANARSNPQSWLSNARSNPQPWWQNARGRVGGSGGSGGRVGGMGGSAALGGMFATSSSGSPLQIIKTHG